MESKLILIPLLPFIGFLLNGLFGKKLGPRFVAWVGALTPIAAFLVAVQVFRAVQSDGALHQHVFDWIQLGGDWAFIDGHWVRQSVLGGLQAPFALLADPLSAVMCLVVTGVGSLIHLYSIDYMRGDRGFHRFFAYLNLFTAFMLVLVLADNLVLLFVGWEGVGLCSYLLIGFWFQDSVNASAGRKAFIVNRIGDFGVLIAIFLCQKYLGTIDTREVARILLSTGDDDVVRRIAGFSFIGLDLVTWITILLFVGATGKSAQIPLFTWLPDAMAGPTPVSALIHAATMVTSGVYLCCRMAPIFEAAPFTLDVIAVIGACTALLAALIALGQNDIKKVLAYSTISQLGYMFFAVGMGAFGAAFFHVVTHAFFKALLFLASGSVIHAMHHEQDMRRMGGLRRQLPFTHAVYFIGTLAIAGVPLFAGFFSKDEILFAGFERAFGAHPETFAAVFWGVTWLTAGITAFYMLRSVALTFWGESRVAPELAPKVHEPWGWIGGVLLVLAVLSIVGGFIGVPEFLGGSNWLGGFTHLHADHAGHSAEELASLHTREWVSLALSVAVGLAGLAAAFHLYGPGRALLAKMVESSAVGARLREWSANKFYIDELYDFLIVWPFHFVSYFFMWVLFDRLFIDTMFVGGSARLVRGVGDGFRRMQSGFAPAYLLTFGCGVLVLLFIVLSLWKESGS